MVVDKQEVTSRAAVKWARRFFSMGETCHLIWRVRGAFLALNFAQFARANI